MSKVPDGIVEQLHASLDSRLSPEVVAGLIRDAIGERLPYQDRRLLERAASARWQGYSSMSSEFERPVPAEHKARMLVVMLGQDQDPGVMDEALAMADDPWRLRGQLHSLAPFVGWNPHVGFNNRLHRQGRQAAGVQLSKRQYNRLVRHLNRMNKRLDRLERQIMLRQLLLVGRSGLAATITLDEMRGDVDAACFVAYWVANKNRRREFSLEGRDNPFDEIAAMLLDRCNDRGEHTDWWMIARAYPNPVVVARLDDARRGELLGRWSSYMRLAAGMLREQYKRWPVTEPTLDDSWWAKRPGLMPPPEARGGGRPLIDRATMVVQSGMDSSTWNTLAQAYNAARAGWINCLGAAGALELLDEFCPGKVMRLMAADLQRAHGGGGHPDTRVWAALPLPWDVLAGDDVCDAEWVERVCRAEGVDPHAAGWTAPRQVGGVAAWKPTPELVHGIEVADPLWAGLLRRAGAWSGKKTGGQVVGYLAEQDTEVSQ